MIFRKFQPKILNSSGTFDTYQTHEYVGENTFLKRDTYIASEFVGEYIELKYTITSSRYVVILPLSGNGVIDWGDGTVEAFSISGQISHTYVYNSISNVKIVRITGYVEALDFYAIRGTLLPSNALMPSDIIHIGNVGLKKLNFAKCGKAYSGMLDNCPDLEDVSTLFYDCNLTMIPDTLFHKCPKITNFAGAFMYCGVEGSYVIPSDFFAYNPLATDFRSVFRAFNTSGDIPYHTTTIPADLFDHNPSAYLFFASFYSYMENVNVIGTAPALWLRTSDANGLSCFAGCSNLTNWGVIPNAWKY